MSVAVNQRVRKRRLALRNAGLRPIQIWGPDSRKPGFAEECARQSKLVAQADEGDGELAAFLEQGLDDLASSGEWE